MLALTKIISLSAAALPVPGSLTAQGISDGVRSTIGSPAAETSSIGDRGTIGSPQATHGGSNSGGNSAFDPGNGGTGAGLAQSNG